MHVFIQCIYSIRILNFSRDMKQMTRSKMSIKVRLGFCVCRGGRFCTCMNSSSAFDLSFVFMNYLVCSGSIGIKSYKRRFSCLQNQLSENATTIFMIKMATPRAIKLPWRMQYFGVIVPFCRFIITETFKNHLCGKKNQVRRKRKLYLQYKVDRKYRPGRRLPPTNR